MISETKLNGTFPEVSFLMNGFTPPYRMDRNPNEVGIALFVGEDIPSRQILLKTVMRIRTLFC